MPPPDPDMLRLCEKKAEAGDGQFAIAYALLRLVQSHEALRKDLCFGPGDGTYPGVLEKIGMEAQSIAEALHDKD